MGVWLRHRLPERVDVAAMLAAGRFVDDDLRAVRDDDRYTPHTFVWFHRDLPDEVEVPGAIEVVHRDERLVVVDKPAFLSSIPRGQHVRQSVVVRLREQLGLPELSPLHRLDRVTSGLLMLATERRWRGPYQSLFQAGEVTKTYRALAPVRDDLDLPVLGARKAGQLALYLFVPFSGPNKMIWHVFCKMKCFCRNRLRKWVATISVY